MFPDLNNLDPHRIRAKLNDGLYAAQVAIWFASDTIARTLDGIEKETLTEYVNRLHSKLVLKTQEKIDLQDCIANNISLALDKLCVYLQQKSQADIVELINILREIGPLVVLGNYLNTVLERCREVEQAATIGAGECFISRHITQKYNIKILTQKYNILAQG